MLDSVRDCFFEFSKRFEGYLPFMYLDVKGLVTIGLGDLIDPESEAYALSYVHPDGSPASKGDVHSAWQAVKQRQDLKLMGGGAFAKLTTIRATDESIQALINAKLEVMNARLLVHFPDFESWPHNAQLATLSMAWAMGPDFPPEWPHFSAACKARDWKAAADNCRMRDADNPGLRPRNNANEQLFRDC